jgi:hypothetical protein
LQSISRSPACSGRSHQTRTSSPGSSARPSTSVSSPS